MISALVTGDLVSDPVQRTTQAGVPFVTANLRVAAGEQAVFVGLSTFSQTAIDRLADLKQGATIAAVGVLEQRVWTDREGNERTGWRLTANEIMTPYMAGKRRRAVEERDEA
ncbi:MAG: single-stranded DNA-binding protein [Burkholderiales bacterium]|nr:single-stranded DNA-binding protein [Burkholderiales bacterium]